MSLIDFFDAASRRHSDVILLPAIRRVFGNNFVPAGQCTITLTSAEEDIERVSMLKEDTSSTAYELIMLVLSMSVKFNVTCLTVTSLITKSCQQRWPIHSCSFYKVVHQQI